MNDVDLGRGFRAMFVKMSAADRASSGIVVTFPAAPACLHPEQLWDGEGRCGGSCAFAGHGQGRPEWTVVSDDPLSVTPSIECPCNVVHPGQGVHGFIRNGQWENAGGWMPA